MALRQSLPRPGRSVNIASNPSVHLTWRQKGIGIILSALLLFVASGRYFGLDRILTRKLGRLGFLAAGSLHRQQE
jgi:hypothetical protein